MTVEEHAIPSAWQRRIRVGEYHRMIEAGVFDDERLELIEGVLVAVSPSSPQHAFVVQMLTRFLACPGYMIRVGLPVTLGEFSEPEPDIAVIPDTQDVRTRHPSTAPLIVEVSRTSLGKDRGVKAALYARAGVSEYWIVDVEGRCVEVRRDPDPVTARFGSLETARPGDTLRPVSLGDVSIDVSELLPS